MKNYPREPSQETAEHRAQNCVGSLHLRCIALFLSLRTLFTAFLLLACHLFLHFTHRSLSDWGSVSFAVSWDERSSFSVHSLGLWTIGGSGYMSAFICFNSFHMQLQQHYQQKVASNRIESTEWNETRGSMKSDRKSVTLCAEIRIGIVLGNKRTMCMIAQTFSYLYLWFIFVRQWAKKAPSVSLPLSVVVV